MLGLVLIVIGILIVVFLASRLFSWTTEARPTITRDQLSTGDIIYSAIPGPSRYLFNLVGIQGGHAMMAVVDDETGEKKLYEITGYRDMKDGNTRPFLHPISDRLDDPDRSEFYMVWKYLGPKISSKRIEELQDKYRENTFNYAFVSDHLRCRFLGYERTTNPVLCCSELVYITLVELGIIEWNDSTWSDSFRYLQCGKLKNYSKAHDLIY